MSVHTQLSAVIAWQLAPLVRPKYLVLLTERSVLEDPDEDVTLDLGDALASVYDRLGLDLAIDYTQPPEVPLLADEYELAKPYLPAS